MSSPIPVVVAILLSLVVCNAKDPLYLAYFGPFAGAWPGGIEMDPAVTLAFADVNAHPDVLPGHELRRVLVRTQCNAGVGVKGLFAVLSDAQKPVVGIVGPGCSVVSGPISQTAALFNLVAVSGSAGSATLSQKSMYPYFLRTVSPHMAYVPAMIALCTYFKWRRVGSITEKTGVTTGTMAVFHEAALAAGIKLTVQLQIGTEEAVKTTSTVIDSALARLKSTDTRIIFVHGYNSFLRRIFCDSFQRFGLAGSSTHVFVVPGWHAFGWWRRNKADVHTCSDDDLKAATQGYLATDRTTVATGPELLPTGINASAWREQYAKRSNVGTSDFGAPAYDATWSWAFVLHELLVKQNLAVTDITSGEAGLKRTYAAMLATNFNGASGRVMFDPNTGDRLGLPLIIENQQDGVEVLVGVHINGNFTKPPTDVVWGGPALGHEETTTPPTDGSDSPALQPSVIDVAPRVSSPLGGKLTIVGLNFRAGVIVVTVADKICTGPVFKSRERIECNLPLGSGGPHTIIVTCGGISSTPQRLVSYNLPHIHGVSQSWVADGTLLRVKGKFFVDKSTLCRIKGYSQWTARYLDTSHIECDISFPKNGANLDSIGTLEMLEVSNDDGQRWVSGVSMDTPIVWGGGKLIPVPPRTVDFPKDVVIGGIIPTDFFSDPEIQKQFIKDVTLAFTMAASAVNAADYFPGNIQLRVEVLRVDPGGSGTQTTVTEVATAFAKKGVANTTNVVGIVGPMWSSNAIPLARAVSNPFQLPVISYDAWTSALDNATEFPYFVRVGPANSDIGKVCGVFMRSMGWSRIAVVTDDDAYTKDFGKQVANDVKENGGTVLYYGVYPMVPPKAVVDQQGQLHAESVKIISSHLLRARAKGARIVFVVAKGDAGRIALYSSLQETGFLNEGYAVMVSLPHKLRSRLSLLSLTLFVIFVTHTKHRCNPEPKSLLGW
jgi:ABC-type branched-subunit amino acid transport system substrate-binding protein